MGKIYMPVVGWIKGERVFNGIKYGWKCTDCKRISYFTKKTYWNSSSESCDYCGNNHTVKIESDNIKY